MKEPTKRARKIRNFLKGKEKFDKKDILNFLETVGYKHPKHAFKDLKFRKFFQEIKIIGEKKEARGKWANSSITPQQRYVYKNIDMWLLGHSLPYWRTNLKRYKKLRNITPEYMEDLTIRQGGCCYYTGIPLRPFQRRGELKYGKGVKTTLSQELQHVSIDKLDPKKGYVKGNIVLASMLANKMKGQCTLNQFKTLILMISKRLNFNEKNHTPDKDLTRIIRKTSKDYRKRTIKDMKKIKKLYAKNIVKLVKRFPGKLVIEKGKVVRTN